MSIEDIKAIIKEDPDFIYSKRFDYRIDNVLERYPDGCPNKIIASVLMISENDVIRIYSETIEKLRNLMKVDLRHD